LDLDHFAFVIKGESSISPIPAGGYKLTKDPVSKDVQINFATDTTDEKPIISLHSNVSGLTIAGLPIQGKVEIKNSGSAYIPGQILYLSSVTFTPHEQTLQIAGVPPFGTLEVPITFNPTNALINTKGTYTVRVAGASTTKSIQSKLVFLTPIGGLVIGALVIIIVFFFVKRLFTK